MKEYSAGGAAQNTIRAAQWMLQMPMATSFIGAVGSDRNANILRKVIQEAGVKEYYMVDKVYPTGKCAALIQDKER